MCATSDLKFPLLQFSPYISLYGSAAILRERKVWVESGRPPFCLKFLVMCPVVVVVVAVTLLCDGLNLL